MSRTLRRHTLVALSLSEVASRVTMLTMLGPVASSPGGVSVSALSMLWIPSACIEAREIVSNMVRSRRNIERIYPLLDTLAHFTM
jgi:hypothetical protein